MLFTSSKFSLEKTIPRQEVKSLDTNSYKRNNKHEIKKKYPYPYDKS